mmetsp:Transcript_12382/g.29490  ORF Transcript_12382/g.29490 Transcript_12382/m.29490 type:complete len:246 (-) Transcript_12382:123-860(-)
MSPLHRAITLKKVNHVSVVIPHNLNFNMLCSFHELFHKHGSIAEGANCFTDGTAVSLPAILLLVHLPHSSPSTSVCCLEHNRVPHRFADFQAFLFVMQRLLDSGNHGYTSIDGDLPRLHLVPHLVHHGVMRPHPHDAIVFSELRHGRVLRQESVPGMDGVAVVLLRHINYPLLIQVSGNRGFARSNHHTLISNNTVHGIFIFLREDRQSSDVKFFGAAADSDGDLSSIGDQQLIDRTGKAVNRLC